MFLYHLISFYQVAAQWLESQSTNGAWLFQMVMQPSIYSLVAVVTLNTRCMCRFWNASLFPAKLDYGMIVVESGAILRWYRIMGSNNTSWIHRPTGTVFSSNHCHRLWRLLESRHTSYCVKMANLAQRQKQYRPKCRHVWCRVTQYRTKVKISGESHHSRIPLQLFA